MGDDDDDVDYGDVVVADSDVDDDVLLMMSAIAVV